jgi:hypothetical protein
MEYEDIRNDISEFQDVIHNKHLLKFVYELKNAPVKKDESESEEVKEDCKPMESESTTDVALVKRTIDHEDDRTAKRLKV